MDKKDPTDGAKRANRYPEGTLVAYRGKPGCDSIVCDHRLLAPGEERDPEDSCLGWHCGRCDAPCSIYGHESCQAIDQEAPDASGE